MTFTFHGISSILNELEKPSIACLLAQYTDSPGRHHCPLALVMFMTRPGKKTFLSKLLAFFPTDPTL